MSGAVQEVNILKVMRVDQLPPVEERNPLILTSDQIELLRGILLGQIIDKGRKNETLEKLLQAKGVAYSQEGSALKISGTVTWLLGLSSKPESLEIARLEAPTELQIDGQNALQYRVKYNQLWAVKPDDAVIQIVEEEKVVQPDQIVEEEKVVQPDKSGSNQVDDLTKTEEVEKPAEKEILKTAEKKEETIPSLPAEEQSIFSKAISAIVYVVTLPIRGLLLLLDWLLGPEELEEAPQPQV